MLCMAFLTAGARAQIAANPVESSGVGEWTISVNGTYLEQNIAGQSVLSRRALLKSSWGMTPWLDLYVLGGAIQLQMDTGHDHIHGFEDKYRLAFGAGLHVSFSSPQLPFIFFAGAQGLRFVSYGHFTEGFWIEEQYYESRFEMRYDWREMKALAGLALPVGMFRLYGAVAQWGLWRLDRKKEYQVADEISNYVGTEEGEYRSGLETGVIAGLQLNFQGRYALTLETLIFDKNNFHIILGICQTGNQGWGAFWN